MNYLKNIYDTIVDNPCTSVVIYFIIGIICVTIYNANVEPKKRI